MAEITRIRNVAFVGPHHAGKTTLVEAVLAYCGAVGRRGSVLDGTTVTDHEPECIAHAESTSLGFAHCTSDDIDITLIDTPGFIDFFNDTRMALFGVDAAVVVVDAEPSRVAQTRQLVDELEALRLPHLFAINKMDRPGADFVGTLRALRELYGSHVVAEQLPIGAAESLRGYVDLAAMTAHTFDGDREKSADIPNELREFATRARNEMLEAMSDFDEHLMEELLDGVDPPLDEVARDLCSECTHDQIVPVVASAGAVGAGVAALVRAIAMWFPSPADRPQIDASGVAIAPDATAPAIARVIKTTIHPQSGKLSVVRIFTGTIKSDATLTDVTREGDRVRCGGLYRLQGKKQDAVAQAGPGEIVGIARLESVATGDTLTANGRAVTLTSVAPSDPVFAVAIAPKERIDEAKISQMLAKIVDEDPALRVARAESTHELLLLGHGEQHVHVAVERLSRKYKVDVNTSPPLIAFQETITQSAEIHARHKHQTGGHGQFGDVWLRFEPRPRGSGISFHDKIVGGVVPRQFIPAVEKGVREALAHGPNGHPVIDLAVTLYDGAYHDVDSNEQSFRTAAAIGVREGLPKCNPVVLEPIARVCVVVPTSYTSSVIQQLTGKRGQILGMNATERAGFDSIEADVPQVELSRYITELRTATQGLGTYTWRHERYDPVANARVGSKAAV